MRELQYKHLLRPLTASPTSEMPISGEKKVFASFARKGAATAGAAPAAEDAAEDAAAPEEAATAKSSMCSSISRNSSLACATALASAACVADHGMASSSESISISDLRDPKPVADDPEEDDGSEDDAS
jgi:hypothetical protein